MILFIFGCAGSTLLFALAFSSCDEQRLLFIVVLGLFVVVCLTGFSSCSAQVSS